MKVVKLYLQCLSHASYILESQGKAAVVDPQRDVDEYVEYLETNDLKLVYILETHLHADFVSGHLELAKRTGAQIVFSEIAGVKFDHLSVNEGDIITLGDSEIKILATPGHTPESICYLVTEKSNPMNQVVFTGDTLFAGDVGRPDLMDATISTEELGGMLYDSLRNKLMTLPDNTKVYPAHGAGSSCGRKLMDVEYSTIGLEKETNYALQPMSKQEFISQVTEDQPIAPKYFFRSAVLNKEGLADISVVLENYKPLGVEEFSDIKSKSEFVILDVRNPEDFAREHIPGSINIGLGGRYAEWVGSLIGEDQKIIFIADKGRETEAATRATRVGFDNVYGYLEGGFEAWKAAENEISNINRIEGRQLEALLENSKPFILDVRKIAEFNTNHIPTATNLPLHQLELKLDKLPKNQQILVHCQTGYRSMIAVSMLKNHGFEKVMDLNGGIEAYLAEKENQTHNKN